MAPSWPTRWRVRSPISFEVDKHDKLTFATVDMGHPVLEPQNVPVDLPANALADDETGFVKDSAIESPWGAFAFTCVSMGNPHAILLHR